MATADQLKNLAANFVGLLEPVLGPLPKREGANPAAVNAWWAEELGDFTPEALRAAAQWWKRTDTSGWWPRSPGAVIAWLEEQGFERKPKVQQLVAPQLDLLMAWRKAANDFYLGQVVRVPADAEGDLLKLYLRHRQAALERLSRQYTLERPEQVEALKPNDVTPAHWFDVLTLMIRDNWLPQRFVETMQALDGEWEERRRQGIIPQGGSLAGRVGQELKDRMAEIQRQNRERDGFPEPGAAPRE